MTSKSLEIKTEKLDTLKSLFPETVSGGKIDIDKLKLTLGEDITIADERYILNWAGKFIEFLAIQTPTNATLKPQREQSINFDMTQTIFIEGENLEG